jgi:protoporphyrinogen oxidase
VNKIAIIIGAGPAGLTAAYELVSKTDIRPIIIEKSNDIGGISKTVVYKGNRMDIGGHRFFSKSDTVLQWWNNILPVQSAEGPNPEKTDLVMLIRQRLSRIFFLRKLFDYPVTLNYKTITNLGLWRIIKIVRAYLWIKIFPVRNIKTLEDFFISRFGRELYSTFFKDYTEKVWGVPCSEIAADWGVQRIKELSVLRAVFQALKSIFVRDGSIEQKGTDTSLINQFLYPKLGPGQMWETVAHIVEEKGGVIVRNAEVNQINISGNSVTELSYINNITGIKTIVKGDYFFSSMPVKDLIASMGDKVPDNVKQVSQGLQYRDFITVGLLLTKLNNPYPDTWIYIQEKDVKLGRIQIFNNWSPYLVSDPGKVWIGLEYFCNEGDELWNKGDDEFINFAIKELHSINIIEKTAVLDSTIIRMPKTYPAYFGTYSRFSEIREFIDPIENLFLTGRNGMHKYNNQDHSMLTSITAVNNIINGVSSKENIWNINTEEKYLS